MTATAITTSREGQLFVLEQHRPEGTEVLVYQTLVRVDGGRATFRTSGGTEWTASRLGGDWFYEGTLITVLREPDA
jgi:hypothetical protein